MKYYPSKTRPLLLLIAMGGFIYSGFRIVESQPVLGWMGMVFGGLAALNFALQLLPGSSFLELGAEKMRYRVFFRNYDVAWPEIKKFTTMTLRDGKSERIGWFLTKEALAGKPQPPQALQDGGERLPDGILPDTYGQNTDDLLSELKTALKDYHSRAASSSAG